MRGNPVHDLLTTLAITWPVLLLFLPLIIKAK
jgi:hypothetical protein